MTRLLSVSPRLHVDDFARSVAFYRDVLGFTVDAMFPDESPDFALLSRDGVGLQIGGPEAAKSPSDRPTVTLSLNVDDAHAWHTRVRGHVVVEWGPEDFVYGRREFAFRDPDGHLIIVSQELPESD